MDYYIISYHIPEISYYINYITPIVSTIIWNPYEVEPIEEEPIFLDLPHSSLRRGPNDKDNQTNC